MALFTDAVIGDLLEDNLETAQFDGAVWSNPRHGGGSPAGRTIDWLTISDRLGGFPKGFALWRVLRAEP